MRKTTFLIAKGEKCAKTQVNLKDKILKLEQIVRLLEAKEKIEAQQKNNVQLQLNSEKREFQRQLKFVEKTNKRKRLKHLAIGGSVGLGISGLLYIFLK